MSCCAILQNYTTLSILERAQQKQGLFSVEINPAELDGCYEIVLDKHDQSLPHTIYVGWDDIWCSCAGYLHALKETALCTHIIIAIQALIDAGKLTLEAIVLYLNSWRLLHGIYHTISA